jgi:hypothetical protein
MLTQFVLVLPMDFANLRELGIFRSSLVEHIYMGKTRAHIHWGLFQMAMRSGGIRIWISFISRRLR